MVATKLESKLRDHYMNSKANALQMDVNPTNRPIVVILERSFDLISMLSHSWTYSTMIHDVLDMKMNRVVISVSSIS